MCVHWGRFDLVGVQREEATKKQHHHHKVASTVCTGITPNTEEGGIRDIGEFHVILNSEKN